MSRLSTYAICATLLLQTLSLAAEPTGRRGVAWQPDLIAAHRLANAQNKPMLIVFGAEWCGYCKKLDQLTLNSPQLAEYINSSFVPVHLDADKDKRAATILEVKSLPCSIVLSPRADLLKRIEGFHSPGPFYQKLSAARDLHAKQIRQTSQTR